MEHTERLFPDGDVERIIVPIVPSLDRVGRWLIAEAPATQTAPPTPNLTGDERARFVQGSIAGQQMTCRLSGIAILANFKSQANIELIKSLLSDTGVMGYVYGSQVAARHYDYPVRRSAYDQLVSWGVPVVKPVIDLPDESHRR